MGPERELLGSTWKEKENGRRKDIKDVGSTARMQFVKTKHSHHLLEPVGAPQEVRSTNRSYGDLPSGFRIIHSTETAELPSQRRFIIDWQSAQPFRTDPTPSRGAKKIKVLSNHTHEKKTPPVAPNYISFSQLKAKSPNGWKAAATHVHGQQPYGAVGNNPTVLTAPQVRSAGKATITGTPTKPQAPAIQMTIFFAGTVNVYENIPLEKAHEIMSLAAKESNMHSNVANLRQETHCPDEVGIRAININQIPVNKNMESRYMDPPSPVSITSGFAGGQTLPGNAMGQTIIGLTPIEELSGPSLFKALPMARKVSLARFLERRKERLANSAPYMSAQKSVDSPGAISHGVIPPQSPNTRLEI